MAWISFPLAVLLIGFSAPLNSCPSARPGGGNRKDGPRREAPGCPHEGPWATCDSETFNPDSHARHNLRHREIGWDRMAAHESLSSDNTCAASSQRQNRE